MNDLTVQPVEPDPATPPPAEPTDPPPAPITADPPGDPPPADPKEHGNKGQTPWFLKRIAEETAKREAESRRAQEAERKAQEALAMLERAQASQQPPTEPRQPAPRPADPGPDFETAVRSEADRRLLYRDTVDVRDAGLNQFGDSFTSALGTLSALGVTTNEDFLADIMAVDKSKAHLILNDLAANPERAANLVGMDPKRRIAELTRLSMTATAKTEPTTPAPKPPVPPKQISKAPPPAPPVEPSASTVVDWRSDKASEEEFDKGFWENQKKRNLRR
jgi:hypothetical protein